MKNATHIGLLLGFATSITIGLAPSVQAGGGNDGPDALKTYYYQPPGGPLNATDRQQLMVYRQQLELQQQSLQLQQDRGTSALTFPQPAFQRPVNPATTSSELNRTQNELDRVNGLLNSPGAGSIVPSPMAGSAPLPIVPMGIGSQFVLPVH